MMRLSSCFCLAAASGVMTYVSLVEVLHESMAKFEEGYELSAHENVGDNGADVKARGSRHLSRNASSLTNSS